MKKDHSRKQKIEEQNNTPCTIGGFIEHISPVSKDDIYEEGGNRGRPKQQVEDDEHRDGLQKRRYEFGN